MSSHLVCSCLGSLVCSLLKALLSLVHSLLGSVACRPHALLALLPGLVCCLLCLLVDTSILFTHEILALQ